MQRPAAAVALTLMLAAIWMVTHRYQGLSSDGELYGMQALARLVPTLDADVYLMNVSQDRYSCFSPLYAWFIAHVGLQQAAALLFALCTVGFLAAAWTLARELFGADGAWLAAVMLVTIVGSYGAYGVLSYSESYLTARSLAEALVVTSLAAHFRGYRLLAAAVVVGALFVHPLMALPGALLLICLWLPARVAILGAVFGTLALAGIALAATVAHATRGPFALIDPAWLEVVRERSQFLFLRYWRVGDWEMHARALLSLALSAMVIDAARIRQLCLGAALVGAAGLAVALIAGQLGPIAILLQGQAWRWFWVTSFVAVLLLAPTAMHAWRDERAGPACAVLLMSAWTFAPVDGTAMSALAVLLWWSRPRIEGRIGRWLRWAGFALMGIVVSWVLANVFTLLTSPPAMSRGEPLWINHVRSIFAMPVVAVVAAGLVWYLITSSRSAWRPALVAIALAVSSLLLVPYALEQANPVGSHGEFEQFADWRRAIPPASNVLIVPSRKSASFIWFTLQRPSYLTVNQSAGVLFSRATALEVQRRSKVLLPIMDPDWKIMTLLGEEDIPGKKAPEHTRPLTRARLAAICGDPTLGFVIAKEELGFDPLRHTGAGSWKDWNLYDCRRVRPTTPTA